MNGPRRESGRSQAWIYYTVIALIGVVAAPASHGATLIGALASGLYATYLYRGGRVVIWFW